MTAIPELFALALHAQQAGDFLEMESLCRRILERDPGNTDALNLFGMLEHQAGRNESAIAYLRRAVTASPRDSTIHYNLGVALQVTGRRVEAIASYRRALQQAPRHAEAHHNLGVALRDEKQPEEAIASFRRAVELQPQNAVFLGDLANLLVTQGKAKEAFPHYQATLRLEPKESAHHSNMANVLILLGKPDEAEVHCREALRLKPDLANAWHNLAIARSCQGYLDEAIENNARALQLQPDHAGANNCQALWALQKGDFESGWRDYRWRWDLPGAVPRNFPQPLWDGSPLDGRTVLVHAEQGLGDTIQFIRYVPLVKERGLRVLVECQPALMRLLGLCQGIEGLIPRGSPLPEFDFHIPLLDLPRLFRTTLATIPGPVPYLFASEELIEYWRRELQPGASFAIGIAWQGNPNFPGDTLRSIPLRHFAPLAQPGVRLFSLQKGAGREQLEGIDFHVNDLGGRLDESNGAFMDTAAVMKNMDLVITSDTAIAHLAGALGVKVWVAIGTGADWRWLLDRDDCPWYPTMRLFRQSKLYEWGELLERMGRALTEARIERRNAAAKLLLSTPRLEFRFSSALEHFQAGRYADAETACQHILECEPCHAEAYNLLGVLAHLAGQNELAIERLDRALHFTPDKAGYHYNRGVALQVLGRQAEAAAAYRQTLGFQSDHADAHHNLGVALAHSGQTIEAESHYRECVRLKPEHAEARHHLGHLLLQQGRFLEAIDQLRELVRTHPDNIKAHHNLGLTLVGTGRCEEGLAHYERVLQLQTDHAETRFCRSMAWLLQGDFRRGWEEYEWRWQSHLAPVERGLQPCWDGSPLAGRSILLRAEQGFGDTFQFLRYASLVKERGGTVHLECQPGLKPLLSRTPGIDSLTEWGDPPPVHDVQAALMSLPRIFGTTLNTVPADVPYLAPDPEIVEACRLELSEIRGFKVGIAWQGLPSNLWDAARSLPLSHFAALAKVPGVRLISLQKGPGSEQLKMNQEFEVIDLGRGLDERSGRFMETAAVMKHLDLVIAVDTAIAHLAGALGVRVWVPLSVGADWRWLLEREDSPWYPTMRLFRQEKLGDWDRVFARMARELKHCVGPCALRMAPLSMADQTTRPSLNRSPRVLVLSFYNVGNFGDRLGYHLINTVLPPAAEIHHAWFNATRGHVPWDVPDGDFDLLVLGIGNSLFQPVLSDELFRLIERVPRTIGIFGTQYREEIDRGRMAALLDHLDTWFARSEEDVALFGQGRKNVVHLGDWLINLFPLTRGRNPEPLVLGDEIWHDLPLDRAIQRIQSHERVFSPYIHPFLCALTSARQVAYRDQRGTGSGLPAGKFHSLLLDVFGRHYPEEEYFEVDREAVMNYKTQVAKNSALLGQRLAELLNVTQ